MKTFPSQGMQLWGWRRQLHMHSGWNHEKIGHLLKNVTFEFSHFLGLILKLRTIQDEWLLLFLADINIYRAIAVQSCIIFTLEEIIKSVLSKMKIHWNPRKLKICVCQTHTQNYHKTIHFSKAWIFAYILIMISEWCDKYFCDYESLNSRSCIIRYFRFTLEICIISWYLGKAEKKAPIHPDLKLTSW